MWDECLESPKEHAGMESETENPDFTKINGLFLHRVKRDRSETESMQQMGGTGEAVLF